MGKRRLEQDIADLAVANRWVEMELAKQLLVTTTDHDEGFADLVANSEVPLVIRLVHAVAILLLVLLAWLGLSRWCWQRIHWDTSTMLVAVHDEDSNRTRHLRQATEKVSANRLRLGRPRGFLCRSFVVPLDWRAWLTGFQPITWWQQALRHAGLVPVPALAAITYRASLGLAEASFWQRCGPPVELALFAHTGLADTSQLERAMQVRGTQTVHVLHGLSPGAVFVGISDKVLPLCKADGVFHVSLGGYRESVCSVAPQPAWQGGWQGKELVLMTNLAHPTNPAYLRSGIAAEIATLEEVASAGNGLELFWKPHPALLSLPAAEQVTLESAASRLGYQRVGSDYQVTEHGSALFVTTVSTTILDLLRSGILPLVYQGLLARDARCPEGIKWAGDPDALKAAIADAAMCDSVSFASAWQSVGPAQALVDGLRALSEGDA